MRNFRLLASLIGLMLFFNCTIVEYNEDMPYVTPLPEFLNSNEIWYVEINQTLGYGEVPFLQMAFTLSFRNGVLYANNNLVGFGSNGNGYGVPVGNYLANNENLQISHVIDGIYDFEVYQTGPNQMELYDPFSETSYFLTGYQRHNFDYDYLFFDNLKYFLEEYSVWEKDFQSNGNYQPFDDENYLMFSSVNQRFSSSLDYNVYNFNSVYWDYQGRFELNNLDVNGYLKRLNLFYDDFDETEFFELYVLSDDTIKLRSLITNKTYHFKGRGLVSYLRPGRGEQKKNNPQSIDGKKRYQNTPKIKNPRTV